jgi:hypothetical protein
VITMVFPGHMGAWLWQGVVPRDQVLASPVAPG